jgi:5-methylcytosine-specific restriction endonuclease McrA
MEVENEFERLAKKFNIPQRPADSSISRRCWGCGGALVSRDINQRYCSRPCRAKHKAKIGRQIRPPVQVNYQAYILSDAWRAKADAAKKRAGYRCMLCNSHRDEVQLECHHRTYERLGHEEPEDLTVLCADCHGLFEKNKALKK